MPQISCSAHTCVHNSDSKCCLSDVRIGGSDAKRSCQTCCDSFREKTEGFTNAANSSCACPDSHIDCAAQKCVFNVEGGCESDRIDVEGAGACDCRDTECATFRK